jgi:phospholipase/lecithinase/hemolysin
MSKSLRNLLAVVSLATISLLSGTAWALPYSSLYVFGDSLADSGNNAVVFDANFGGARTPTPLATPLIPTFPYASNRYSNGPVWVEYFAGNLGLSAQPAMLGGTNFAFGGARTGPGGSSFPYSLTDQVGMFLGATGGVAPGSALYVLEGGGNDARDVLTAALGGGNPFPLIQAYVKNIANILTSLALAGADQFLLWNVPDIGKIPAITAFGPQASSAASFLVSQMNLALAQALAGLSPAITDGIHLFDAYDAFNEIVNDPGAFGFSNVKDACAMSAACVADPAGYFFWDGIHPTTAGHAAMAALALAQIPEPQTILLLTVGLIGVFVSRRKAA